MARMRMHPSHCGIPYMAALKQIPSCEFFPIEAAKTNILGTENVLMAAIEAGVKTVVCLSTDKAAYLVNAIGTSNPITITEPSMTRFIMSLDEAVDLVLFAFENGVSGDILVQKAPACTIETQAKAVMQLFGGKEEDIKVIGIRHGEKIASLAYIQERLAEDK